MKIRNSVDKNVNEDGRGQRPRDKQFYDLISERQAFMDRFTALRRALLQKNHAKNINLGKMFKLNQIQDRLLTDL